jgi:pimeloyl-ACP methyl ester carboxylesterase
VRLQKMRSPSQWPASVLASIVLGRSWMEIFLGGTYRSPLLAVWGKNDPLFIPAEAEAFRREIPDAEICFFGTGHFALETHAGEICQSN